MEQSWKTLFLLTFFCTFGLMTSAKAQITPDNSLGAETSIVGQPNQAINGIPINQIDQINGGARRGGNLFHSFGEFNVDAGRAAYFTNPDGVGNILTRVTGVNRSNILGTLGVLGNANLFLINPNGIFFGANASLDVRGSFLGSSANSLLFDNGFEFSATNPQAPPLLTVNIPIGLRFRDNPGEIRVQGLGQTNGLGGAANSFDNPTLQVPVGENLTLVGGNVSLDGGVLQATGGRVQLGGLTAAGTVGINPNGTLSFPDGVARGDVSLTNRAGINVIANQLGGGSIDINARNIGISGLSLLSAGIAENLGTVNNPAGNIALNATGETRIDQSRIEDNVNSGTIANSGNIGITTGSFVLTNQAQLDTSNSGQGQSGDINIKADSVLLDDAVLQTSNAGQGNAGDITVQAKDTISLANFSFILSNVGSRQGVPANGNVGNILLDARVVSLTDTSQLQTRFFANAQGNPGSVSIRARESVSFTGQNTGIFADVVPGGLGDGSNIEILAGSVFLDNARLQASNAGQGNAGNVTVQAKDTISLANRSFIFSNVGNGQGVAANGNVGNILLDARVVSLTDTSQLQTRFFANAQGNPGSVSIRARESVSFTGQNSGIFADVVPGGLGDGSNIEILAGSVFLDNARLQASNAGQGNAGDITVQAKDTISLANRSFIFSNVGNGQGVAARGDVGNILLDARVVSLTDTSQLQAGFFANAQGNPGSVSIRARESVSFTGQNSGIFANVDSGGLGDGSDVQISAESFSLKDGAVLVTTNAGRGNGGDIAINVGSLSLTNGSVIRSNTFGQGNAGNVNIQARNLVEVLGTEEPGTNSSISANVSTGATGNAGDLTIETKKLVIISSQVGSTTSGKGNAGNVRINATESVEVRGKVFSRGESGQLIRNPAGLFAQVNITGEGNGGNLTIDTPRLSVGDGARVQVATFGQGDAGNLLIRASDIDVYETANANFFPGGIFAGFQVDEDEQRVPPKGGNGGTLTIETDRLRVRDGGRISATTQGQGNAGLLQIRAKDSVEVFGLSPNNRYISEISAGATPESTGTGGSLRINTGKLIVRDRGTITVRSENTQPAGNLEITARTINLENQGSLTATTNSGDGGDITLNVRDYLFLRGNSEISTSARGNGNGGNITINTPFIVAFPQNNDIIANAVSGNGGRVRTNATLFGIIPRTRADLERLGVPGLNPRNLSTSDITAFSEQNSNFGDNLQLNSPDVDPSRGLVELPETLTDTTQKIAQSPCRQGFGNEFVVTGRGGLPTSPNETLNSDNVRVDLLQPVASSGNSPSATIKPATTVTARRVPAQGWIFNDKGQVVLTAYDPTNTGSQRPFSTAACPAR
jgi:filamentous hemagglutinin family protein